MSHKIQSRRCRQCHQLKPVTEFNAGFAWCKKCVSAYNAAYYAANKKKLAAYYAAYKAAHRKRLNVYYAAYYAANRKRIVARKAAFYYARKKQRAGSPAGAAKKGRGRIRHPPPRAHPENQTVTTRNGNQQMPHG